jgi:hypothetical protein
MTREEFLGLPLLVQVRLLFDALDEESSRALLAQEKPVVPKAPRYDMAIYRSGGNSWASEHSLEGLVWWRNRYQAGADGGGQYAEADKKRVANLSKWIAWRECFPADCWGGTRGEDEVVAKPPSTKPTVYPRQNSNGRPRQQEQAPAEDVDPDNFNF